MIYKNELNGLTNEWLRIEIEETIKEETMVDTVFFTDNDHNVYGYNWHYNQHICWGLYSGAYGFYKAECKHLKLIEIGHREAIDIIYDKMLRQREQVS